MGRLAGMRKVRVTVSSSCKLVAKVAADLSIFRLEVIQQPCRARACGFGDKVRLTCTDYLLTWPGPPTVVPHPRDTAESVSPQRRGSGR